jgi:hypothetical protein
VSARLRALIAEDFETAYEFEQHTGLAHATVNAWRNGRVPDSAQLIVLARLTGWSLDYLLTGEGPQRRGEPTPRRDLAQAVRDYAIQGALQAHYIETKAQAEKIIPSGHELLKGVMESIGKRVLLARSLLRGLGVRAS